MSYSLIVEALKDAGILAAGATEAEIDAALASVYRQLALGTQATGTGLTEGQIAKAIANQTGFAQRVANTIRTTRGIQALSSGARGGVARMLSPALRNVLIHGSRAGASLLSWPAVLAAFAVLAAISGGTYLYSNWGKPSSAPVQPGPRMDQPAAPPVTGPDAVEGENYAVFLLPDNSGGTIYIGQEATLKRWRTCDTPNGGRCDDPNAVYPPVRYEQKSADFDTAGEALAAACQAGPVKSGHWGNKLVAYGGEYWFEGACS
jgi:hypothetical protein